MEPVKPIKRSEELTPLSREHHDGLLFVWKIRQGIKNGTSLSVLSDYLSWYRENHLEPHFKEEEQILPSLIQSENLRNQFQFEHASIRTLIEKSILTPEIDTMEKLANTVNDHIRFEERVLFPHVEEVTDPKLLKNVTQNLQPHTCSVDWQNEFWVVKKH